MDINLRPILKMLGIEVSAEHCRAVEAIIPEIPAKLQQAVGVVNLSLKNFDERLRAIETQQAAILKLLEGNHDAKRTRSA